MELSQDLEGCVVTIQLGRPLYLIDYAGHVKFPGKEESLIGDPIMQGNGENAKPVAMDILIGVTVKEVHKDHIIVVMVTLHNHRAQARIPSALILQVHEMLDFEPTDLPVVTRHIRDQSKKPLVTL